MPRDRSFAVRKPELLAELHPSRNGEIDPYSIGYASKRRLWWRCQQCGHEWSSNVATRALGGHGCPRCFFAHHIPKLAQLNRTRPRTVRPWQLLATPGGLEGPEMADVRSDARGDHRIRRDRLGQSPPLRTRRSSRARSARVRPAHIRLRGQPQLAHLAARPDHGRGTPSARTSRPQAGNPRSGSSR
ncbi:MAG: zinc-ribbon domain-containing protein [Solirubrobacteraceae bacterium]